LAADPTYSQAAYYLGLTYHALFDYKKAAEYYKMAIAIDPDYVGARAYYAGMLFDTGDVDEAIRQLNAVLQRDPKHVGALTMQAEAYRLKDLYPQSIDAARKAIKLNPAIGEPHLWLADSLRLSGKYAEARSEYDRYLTLSDFNSKLAGKFAFYMFGFLSGSTNKRGSTKDIWEDLRNLAYFGICNCEYQLSQFDAAIASCQKSLTYDHKDPYTHFLLGKAYMAKFKTPEGGLSDLAAAQRHLQEAVDINGDMAEAKIARQNIANIQKGLADEAAR
jgi:tetratricopeptide (TPR) repeat protein